jgi:8-oxo-dGTP diphosphatase
MANEYACALLVRDGQILLGLRSPQRRLYPNLWDVLGGRVEPGETLTQALRRELSEELGIEPDREAVWLAGVVEDEAAHLTGRLIYHMFVVERWRGGEPRIANDEHVRLHWFTPEEACALNDLAVDAYRKLFRIVAARIGPA